LSMFRTLESRPQFSRMQHTFCNSLCHAPFSGTARR
jgi:hypothetical protein